MASTINASTTSTSGLVQTADASGILQLQSNGVTGLTVGTGGNVIVNTNLTVTTAFTANVRSQTTNIPPVFQDSAGTEIGTLCRAWVNYNGISNSINAAFNVSSVTDGGTGIFTVNFANALPTSNYASCFTAQNGTRGVCCNIAGSAGASGTPTQKNTLGVQMTIRVEGTGSLADCTDVSVSVFY